MASRDREVKETREKHLRAAAERADAINQQFVSSPCAGNAPLPRGLADRLTSHINLAQDAMIRVDNVAARLYGADVSKGERDSGDRPPEPVLTLCDRLESVLIEINERLLVIQQTL